MAVVRWRSPEYPARALARRIGRSLVEVGLSLHRCEQHDPMYRLGGVCLQSVEAQPGKNPEGIVVTWTTHDVLLLDEKRWASYFVMHQVMNATLGTILKALGYDAQPHGSGGAWIIAIDQDGASERQSP